MTIWVDYFGITVSFKNKTDLSSEWLLLGILHVTCIHALNQIVQNACMFFCLAYKQYKIFKGMNDKKQSNAKISKKQFYEIFESLENNGR